MDITIETKQYRRNKIHPQKFAVIVACVSLCMVFMGFTSAFVVRQAAGDWLEFPLPNMFFVSTGVILLSSLTLQGSYIFFKKGNPALYKGLLFATLVLGLLFFVVQFWGWQTMWEDMGISLGKNPSGDFVYLISWVHAAHVFGGIATLIVALIHAISLKYKVTTKRLTRFEMTLIFWHFIGFLWLYLVVFFQLQS